MSGRIGQRLEPGERVVCRLWEGGERRDWRRVMIPAAVTIAAILVANVVGYLVRDDQLWFGLSMLIAFLWPLSIAEDNTTDAAVTDRRLLIVTGWNPTFTSEVKPDEIESVEILRGALRVRRPDAPPILLFRRRGAAELAAAIAELGQLPPPQPPGPRDLAAARMMLTSILAAGYAAGLACIVLSAQEPWTQEGVGHAYKAFFLMVGAMATGLLLGPLVGLVLVRRNFTRTEMRAWIESSASFARAMAAGGLCARLAHRYRALADRLYGPPSSSDNTKAERHGG